MSATDATLSTPLSSDWHRVGAGLSVRFSITPQGVGAEWLPRVPTKREFRRITERYRAARHVFLGDLAQAMGRNIICLELPPNA